MNEIIEKFHNVWTVRITVPLLHREIFNKGFLAYQDFLENSSQVVKCVMFRELTKKKVLHYHLRMICKWKTRPSVLKALQESFIHFKRLGNKIYSTHMCFVNGIMYDKSLVGSQNYIAKDGDIIYSKGYSDEEIKELIKQSKAHNEYLKLPVHKKIMVQYDIKHADQIPPAIVAFYDHINKIPPRMFHVQEMARKILWEISLDYRKKYKKHIENYINSEISGYD